MFGAAWKFLQSYHSRPIQTKRPRRRRNALRLERLEDRALLTTHTVTSVADSGAGTLRQAILDANAGSGDLIQFNIAGNGVHTINLLSPLHTLDKSVTIDGTTQHGYAGSPLIDVEGGQAGNASGLVVKAGPTTIKGLIVSGFTWDGIVIQGGSSSTIQANYIGTDSTGAKADSNGEDGVLIDSSSTSNLVTGNVISANGLVKGVVQGFPGVEISGSGTNQNVVTGNMIGVDVTGANALGNGGVGVYINSGAASNRVGTNGDGVNDAAERNIISANSYQGVAIQGTGTNQNVVAGNYVGTDATGTVALGNGNNGIWVLAGAQSNRIGVLDTDTNAAADANLISGNTFSGVLISDSGTNSNVVAGNLIGTDVSGKTTLANGNDGVAITNSAQSNLIGSNGNGVNDSLERNIISGNNNTGEAGIYISDSGTNSNVVAGNYVGLDVSGTKPLGNGGVGVYLANGTQSNRIGVSSSDADPAGESNVISSNPYQGVAVQGTASGTDTNDNIVAGNLIGTDATGAMPMGNGNNGIWVLAGAQGNLIGVNPSDANASSEGNVISANTYSGVEISDSGTNSNTVVGNKIGTDISGANPLGNGNWGVSIDNSAQSNTVGDPSSLSGNTIDFNAFGGVAVIGSSTTGNSIRANSIANNSGLGIDLNGDGVTVNNTGNVDAGPNNLQNYPVILSATAGNPTSATGTLNSTASTTFTLDFYSSAVPNPVFFGDGGTYLGSATVMTDASGNATFAASLATSTSVGQWITATATDPNGNTSEFSGARKLNAAAVTLNPSSWVPIGPAPIADNQPGGRVSVAAPDPTNVNVAYLGADGGGVWKTTDFLDPVPVWTPMTDSQASIQFSNWDYNGLVVAHSNHNTLYAAMTGPSGRVLESTNGGSSWTAKGTTEFESATFGSLAVNPTSSANLYVSVWFGAVHGGGIYHSTNSGGTWVNTTSGIPAEASDVVMDPSSPSTLYAGLVNASNSANNGIWKTTNGGTSWTQLAGGLPPGADVGATVRLAISPSTPQTLYATVFDTTLGNGISGEPHRFVSTDGGSSWTALSALPAGDEFRFWHAVLAVDPSNSKIVYTNGDHEFYRSTDSGTTWTAFYDDDPTNVFFDHNGAAVLVGDRGIYRWTGPGTAVVPKQGNLQNAQFYTLTLDPNNTNTAYGTVQDQFGALKFTGIPQWNFLSNTSETGKLLVDPQNSARVYAYDPLDAASFIWRSDDGGATWTSKGKGISTSSAGFGLAYAAQNAFAIDSTTPSRLLLGTTDVYLSTDDASTWTDLTNGPLSGSAYVTVVGFSSQTNTFYAGTSDGHFFRSTDGGTTWQKADTGLPLNGFDHVMEMQVDPSNANRVFMVMGNFANDVGDITPNVWTTTNGGTSWSNITAKIPATYQTLSIAVDWRFAKPVLYVGTARGVYSSSNLGVSWAAFGSALPHTAVSDLQFDPKHDILAAATYGRGVFEIEVPGPATSLVMSGPASAVVGTQVSITLTAYDAAGNVAIGFKDTVTFTSTDPTVSLPNYTFTAADKGSHTFKVTFGTTGSQTITGTDKLHKKLFGSITVDVTAS
jgi:hypothetical protein